MAVYSGPEIANSGLVFNLDVPNAKNFELSSVEVLVVAGGGGGGYEMGGGGGAGGFVYNSSYSVTPGTNYTVTIGAGGAGRTSNSDNTNSATNSVFGSITAYAGGAGGNNSYTYDGTNTGGRPMSGGSGGGSGEGQSVAPGVSGQGNSGGPAIESGIYHSGGGGGAGTSGQGGQPFGSGNGGRGVLSFISSSGASYYSGGGAGGNYAFSSIPITRAGTGGIGGGGDSNLNSYGNNGTANTGGGGGGGSYNPSYYGGNGGSGIVIVRYRGPQRAIGGTVTKVDNDTVHTFTTSSTFLPLRRANNGESVNSIVDMSSNIIGTCSSVTYNTANNGYLDFNGSSSELNFSPAAGLTGTGSWTMCAWFKINGAPQNTLWQNVIIDTDATGGSANMICADYGGYHGGTQHQLLYTSRPSTGGGYTTLTGPTLTVGTWYHALVARNGATDTKLYVNGALYNTFNGNLPTATQPLIRLGRWTDGTNYANVSIAAAQIYNRALSASEVNNLYQASRDRFGV